MTRITLLEGAGRYADPWHPFSSTSSAIADELAALGAVVRRTDIEDALSELHEPDRRPDLLVLNVGNAGEGTPPPSARSGLIAAVDAGMPVLGIHCSATAFPDWDAWPRVLGGRWVRGRTFHPPQSACTIVLTEEGRRLTGGLTSIRTVDERYTDLALEPESVPLAVHEHKGSVHPLAWRFDHGSRRALYYGLGHDEAAYRSQGSRLLLRRSAQHLLDDLRSPSTVATSPPPRHNPPTRSFGDEV